MAIVSAFWASLTSFLSDDTAIRSMQLMLLIGGTALLFLLFYTLRDILLRTRSFAYQFACILVVALLPGIGFLLYLLMRPARTIKEREQELMLQSLVQALLLDEDEENDLAEDLSVLEVLDEDIGTDEEDQKDDEEEKEEQEEGKQDADEDDEDVSSDRKGRSS